MADIKLNTGYPLTNHGIIKILQIVFGFIICSLLCANWYGGQSCFAEGRMGYVSGLNFVVVIINIVLFVINFLNIAAFELEKMYSAVCTILFIIATVLLIWFIIEKGSTGSLIAATVFVGIEFLLFVWDYQILHAVSNY